jgi:hypothetical protein
MHTVVPFFILNSGNCSNYRLEGFSMARGRLDGQSFEAVAFVPGLSEPSARSLDGFAGAVFGGDGYAGKGSIAQVGST